MNQQGILQVLIKYYMIWKCNMTKHTVIMGTCETMAELDDDSIGLIFTSPPYALAKHYGDTGGIGMTNNVDAYNEYLTRMKWVLQECKRVLKFGRFIGINVADVCQHYKGKWHRKPIRFDYYNMIQEIGGFVYVDVMMWKKPEGMTTQRRFGHLIQNPYPLYYLPNNTYEPIIVFRKLGRYLPNDREKKENKLKWEDYKRYQTDIWEIQPETNSNHPAPFPILLPKLFIELYSLKGDTVLDPFLGSGTTMKACINVGGRHSVGFEINPDYIELIKKRVGFDQQTLGDYGVGDKLDFEIIKRD